MKIHNSWDKLFSKHQINLDDIYTNNNIIFPSKKFVFRVFEMDIMEIKIVLLGQDPYYTEYLATGFSFSVPKYLKIPPSLKNIYKELQLEFPERKYKFKNGNIERWFYDEKIFLLNSSLTVEKNKPSSHIKFWKKFTDNVIKYISHNNKKCIFLLLGNYAKSKSLFIENKKNIVYAGHPSPNTKGFIGSNVFIQVENKLNKNINWNI